QGRRLNTAQVSGPVVGANSPRRSRVGLRVIGGGPCSHFLHDLGVRLNETRGKDALREAGPGGKPTLFNHRGRFFPVTPRSFPDLTGGANEGQRLYQVRVVQGETLSNYPAHGDAD